MVLSAEDISYVFKRKICNVVYDVYGYLSCRYNLFRSSCAFYIVCRNAVAVCNVCNYFFRRRLRRLGSRYYSGEQRPCVINRYILAFVENCFVGSELFDYALYLSYVTLCVLGYICQNVV